MSIKNPFILENNVADEYFCDRDAETALLRRHIENGRNVVLLSPRRVGKTGLLYHFFRQPDIQRDYYTVLIDLYTTKTLEEMVDVMGKAIFTALSSKSQKAAAAFMAYVKALYGGISIDEEGNPMIKVGVDKARDPRTTVEEMFSYIDHADKPCIIAIDEFQVVAGYPDGNAEALLRTYIQRSLNGHYIFSGNQRTLMSEMFLSPSRPFYQSTTMMNIDVLDKAVYADFATRLFEQYNKSITPQTIEDVYAKFEGITWYLQRTLNELFAETEPHQQCTPDMVPQAINSILAANHFSYSSTLFQLPSKQKDLLIAICQEGKATQITSGKFIKQHRLLSASSVQSAIKGLLDKEFVTMEMGVYEAYDKFFALWLRRNS